MSFRISEENQHELLLVITALLFVLFSTGTGTPRQVTTEPIIIPSA